MEEIIKNKTANIVRKTLTPYQIQKLIEIGIIRNYMFDISNLDLSSYWVKVSNISAERIDNSSQFSKNRINNSNQVSRDINNSDQMGIENINNMQQESAEIYNGKQKAKIIHIEYQEGKFEG